MTDTAGGDQVPGWVEPMLAKPDGGRLPSEPDWAYDYKLDFCTRFGSVGWTPCHIAQRQWRSTLAIDIVPGACRVGER
jgi:hypothetical protein